MSFKYHAQQDGPNKYVLEKLPGMCCEVIAYLSPELFAETDETLWADSVYCASIPGTTDFFLMPDCHVGYTTPVGSVHITDGTIVQAATGYDAGCGCLLLKVVGLHAADIVDWEKRKAWILRVEHYIATGNHNQLAPGMKAPTSRKMSEVFRYGAKALGISADLCERHHFEIDDEQFDEWELKRRVDPNASLVGTAQQQFGSVGGGNHFVELQVDRDDGSVWVMVHCGSRGYGFDVANHYFLKGAELRGLSSKQKEKSWLNIDEPLGKKFWNAQNSAANYASANRHQIVDGIRKATQEIFQVDVERYFEISHNLIKKEKVRLPDGTFKDGYVHRKGSTAAFPAGHPEIEGTVWEKTGHPVLIPGSMRDGAAILFPLDGAYESGCSVNHGSGRKMARGQAKRDLEAVHDEIDHEMRNVRRTMDGVDVVGIAGNTDRTPLDECGEVYKNLDTVLGVLVDSGIAEISRRLYPVANVKGT